MKDEFKNWNIGLIFILIVMTLIYFISNIFLQIELSILESWGIVMIFIAIFSGIQTYNTSKNANLSE